MSTPAAEGDVIEAGRLRRLWREIVRQVWRFRLKRWIPRLVWLGDEVDVVVTLQEHKLGGEQSNGVLWEIEDRLSRMGVRFDRGMGMNGRDWEWDYSLSGPISVRFRGRASRPEHRIRRERHKPRLVLNASRDCAIADPDHVGAASTQEPKP